MKLLNQKRGSQSCSVFVLFSSALTIFLAGFSQAAYSQGIQVSPSRIFFQAAPGTGSVQQVSITNSGDAPLTLAASFEDWVRDSLGEKKYSAPGTLENSNAQWLLPSPQQLEIPAGGKATLNIQIKVPGNANPVTNSMLFLTQINEQKPIYQKDENGHAVGIKIRVRMGVHVYNTLSTVDQKINLTFLSFEDLGKNSDSTRLLDLKVQNKSAGLTDGNLRLEMTHIATGKQVKFPARALPMLPGAVQHSRFVVPLNLPKGRYQVLAILDGGNNSDLKIAKKEIVYE